MINASLVTQLSLCIPLFPVTFLHLVPQLPVENPIRAKHENHHITPKPPNNPPRKNVGIQQQSRTFATKRKQVSGVNQHQPKPPFLHTPTKVPESKIKVALFQLRQPAYRTHFQTGKPRTTNTQHPKNPYTPTQKRHTTKNTTQHNEIHKRETFRLDTISVLNQL